MYEDAHFLLVDELLNCETVVTTPSSSNFIKNLKHNHIDGIFATVKPANDNPMQNKVEKRKLKGG